MDVELVAKQAAFRLSECVVSSFPTASKPGYRCDARSCDVQPSLRLKQESMKNTSERFWGKVRKTPGCWYWVAGLNTSGYGAFKAGGKQVSAHRWAWEHHNGTKIPDGAMVRHTCDTPACVNPDHLVLGTAAQNSRDMVQRGRHTPVQSRTKLTWANIPVIRILANTGFYSYDEIANVFAVAPSTIGEVVRGKSWVYTSPVATR